MTPFWCAVLVALVMLYLMLAMAFDLLIQAGAAWARDWRQFRRGPCRNRAMVPVSSDRDGGPPAICAGPPVLPESMASSAARYRGTYGG